MFQLALILLDLQLRQTQLLAHHPQRGEQVPEVALRQTVRSQGEFACRDALGEIHGGVERFGNAGDHAVDEPGRDQEREQGGGRHDLALAPCRVDGLRDGRGACLVVTCLERTNCLARLPDLGLQRQQPLERHGDRDLARQGPEACGNGRRARVLAAQRSGGRHRLPQRLIGALSEAPHIHGVRGIGHERLEAVLRRPR